MSKISYTIDNKEQDFLLVISKRKKDIYKCLAWLSWKINKLKWYPQVSSGGFVVKLKYPESEITKISMLITTFGAMNPQLDLHQRDKLGVIN